MWNTLIFRQLKILHWLLDAHLTSSAAAVNEKRTANQAYGRFPSSVSASAISSSPSSRPAQCSRGNDYIPPDTRWHGDTFDDFTCDLEGQLESP